jgi:hypothetical protein
MAARCARPAGVRIEKHKHRVIKWCLRFPILAPAGCRPKAGAPSVPFHAAVSPLGASLRVLSVSALALLCVLRPLCGPPLLESRI